MNIIGHRKLFLFVSGILIAASIASVIIFGLVFGIDFLGGTLWQMKIENSSVNTETLRDFFNRETSFQNASVYVDATTESFLVRLGQMSEADHQKYLEMLRGEFGAIEELRFDAIGPAIGKELRDKALKAVILVLFGISLYVTFAFRKVSYPIKSWKYGLITLFTLFHDVIIPVGLFAVLGHYLGIEIDINFVVAVLVVMGFSVHDTIVVFDRIRENLVENRKALDFGGLASLINRSVNQTIARSINTSLTLILVLLAMFFLGPSSLKYFILVILVGVTVGTYSSIFVASPILLSISRLKNSER